MNQNKNMEPLLSIGTPPCGFYPLRCGTASAQKTRTLKIAMYQSEYQILFGDSSPETNIFLEGALAHCPAFGLAQHVTDISELVSYLAGAGKFVDKARFPPADLVLVDLNLSGRASGLEVLKWIQRQPTRDYRVVVFSAAADDPYCEQAYALGADGFVTKPRIVAEMVHTLGRIEGWLRNSIVEDEPLDFCVA
jgi:CheY-like chemotaxis protein